MHILGIDPGISGAISLIDDRGVFCELRDIPIMVKNKGTGKVKNCVNPRGLQDILASFIAEYGDIVAYLENINAMPGQGVSSVFSLGDTFGSIKAVLACEGVETNLVSPVTWKKHFKIVSDKEVARALAIRLYPSASQYLERKKDADRAEALLIARYAYETIRCR